MNEFLPWFPLKDKQEASHFYEQRLKNKKYCFAICLKEDNRPVGYIKIEDDDSYDLGYALEKKYWHQGITSEAGAMMLELAKMEYLPYLTATHDVRNQRSGSTMQRIGFKYQYSYEEMWEPKHILVTFKMYQLNISCDDNFVYKKYWDKYDKHFIDEQFKKY